LQILQALSDDCGTLFLRGITTPRRVSAQQSSKEQADNNAFDAARITGRRWMEV
jgi:hypothetical protein